MTRYRTNLATVGHGDEVYQAVDGVVEMPSAPWQNPLVANGTLVPLQDDAEIIGLEGLEAQDEHLVQLLRDAGYMSANELEEASDEELRAVNGIGAASLRKIKNWLDGLYNK